MFRKGSLKYIFPENFVKVWRFQNSYRLDLICDEKDISCKEENGYGSCGLAGWHY